MNKGLLKHIFLLILGIAVVIPSILFAHGTHYNAISDNYNNTIIDDVAFRAKSTMTQAEIQAFLSSKGSALTSYSINFDTYIGPNDTINANGMSAAQIIYNAANWYNINPQVILATLQKESSLVTSGNLNYLNEAMGYGCPESAGCSTSFANFARQIDYATYQFDFNFRGSEAADTTRVQSYYRGNTITLDGKSTYIANSSTASLYRYTPHRPDSAYLTATNGSHYYGNYNFIYFFNLWFIPYNYEFVSAINPPESIVPGQKRSVQVVIKNTGSSTWYNDTQNPLSTPTRLLVHSGSELNPGDSTWESSTRIRMTTNIVLPGQNGVFTFNIKAPTTEGDYSLKFYPIIENVIWLKDVGMRFDVASFDPGKAHRFWSATRNAHFYTNSLADFRYVKANPSIWKYEGLSFSVSTVSGSGLLPVYRFWNSSRQVHFYTISEVEKQLIINTMPEWKLEGPVYYLSAGAQTGYSPVYRFYNLGTGTHFYTISESEKNSVITNMSKTWRFEGISWYARS